MKSTVVEVRGLHWATSKAVIELVLRQRPGVAAVDANPVARTATVKFDPSRTSVEQISGWVRDGDCGYHCRGESVPEHVCCPMDGTLHDPGMIHGAAPRTEARAPSGHLHPAVHPMEHGHPAHGDHQGMYAGHGPGPAEQETGHAQPETGKQTPEASTARTARPLAPAGTR